MQCEECGKDFVGRIGSRDGEDKVIPKLCSDCKEQQEEQEHYEELQKMLPAEMESQRLHWRESCNVPWKFRGSTFDNFLRSRQPKAYDVCKKYDPQAEPAESLLMLSVRQYGLGKTHLVCAIINREIATRDPARVIKGRGIVRYPCSGYFTTEVEILDRIKATFNNKEEETEQKIYRELTRNTLLVIDDIGKTRPKDYSFVQSVIFRIIDSRYVNEQPTIITTNLDYVDFEEHIGGACADRLREMCGANIVKLQGKSYRVDKGKEVK